MSFGEHKTIVVTGGAGCLGSFVMKKFVQERGADPQRLIRPHSEGCDLRRWKTSAKINEVNKFVAEGDLEFQNKYIDKIMNFKKRRLP